MLQERLDAKELGTEFDVQKDRMNGQITNHKRPPTYPEYCPVTLALKIIARAQILGYGEPEDPLCVGWRARERGPFWTIKDPWGAILTP